MPMTMRRLSALMTLASAAAAISGGRSVSIGGRATMRSFRSGEPWYDTDGNVIDAHGAGLLAHGGRYYWYGSRRTMNASGTQMDGGIALYSSSDLYAWTFESVLIHPFNCTSPGASSIPGAASYPAPSCKNGNGLDLERPKVVKCGEPGGKFVMWVRGTGTGNTPQNLGVAVSDSPTGPFTFVSNASGSDDPFRTVAAGIENYPPGYQYADATLFQDPATLKTYVYWRTRMTTGLDGSTTGFRGMELTADCRGVVPESDTRITLTPNREGPAMFLHEGTYYLYVSGTMGWAPTTMYVYSASEPLGNFSASNQDEHYWHAYTKGLSGNSSGWNGTWAVRDGYQLVGEPFIDRRCNLSFVTLPFADAVSICAQAAACAGFSFIDYDAAPAPAKMSTYILPNPMYSKGSRRAPFIYMGDRWDYSNTFGTSKATYVWLPLFVHPTDPGKVQVVWREEWSLNDTSVYPF